MAERVLLVLIMLGLGTDFPSCSGFPVYDYNPSSLAEALRASVEKVNSQSLSPYLFQAFRSTLKRVSALSVDTIVMHLEFSIRETTCLKDSGEDPSTCPFQRDYYEPPTTCKSTVRMSEEQVQNVWARCRWPSTSESNSSEEVFYLTSSEVDVAMSGHWSCREGNFLPHREGCQTTSAGQESILALSDIPKMFRGPPWSSD